MSALLSFLNSTLCTNRPHENNVFTLRACITCSNVVTYIARAYLIKALGSLLKLFHLHVIVCEAHQHYANIAWHSPDHEGNLAALFTHLDDFVIVLQRHVAIADTIQGKQLATRRYVYKCMDTCQAHVFVGLCMCTWHLARRCLLDSIHSPKHLL